MAFINAEQVSPGVWQLRCNSCGKDLDIVDADYLDWLHQTKERAYCFKCDSVSADEPPAFFWNISEGAFVFWDDNRFFGSALTFSDLSGMVEQEVFLVSNKIPLPPLELPITACLFVHKSTSGEGMVGNE